MDSKAFEHAIPFLAVQDQNGNPLWLPIVLVSLIQPGGNRVQLPLLFDTGASVTTLRQDFFSFLGLSRWDEGPPEQVGTAGGPAPVTVHRYTATLELLGKTIVNCPVHLAALPPNPLYVGLLGRQQVFEQFGFGFWEREHVLYATDNP